MVRLSELYYVFFKVGLLLLGGGYVILPLLRSEIVEKRNWIREEDLVNYFALSQSLPGIIAANISIFTGYRIRGKIGAVIAVLGVISSPFISILLIATFLNKIAEIQFVQSIFAGVAVGLVVLLFSAVREMWAKSIRSKFSFLIFILAFLLMYLGYVSPVYLVIGGVFLGVLKSYLSERGRK